MFSSDFLFFFFKQKTAYDMRISDWSSDVCSSDLKAQAAAEAARPYAERLEGVVASLASKVGAADSAPKLLSGTGKSDTHLLLVLNSDRGLAGAFNSNIVKAARDKALELQAAGKTVRFFLVGRKGRPVINRLRKSTRLNSSHYCASRMPSSACKKK